MAAPAPLPYWLDQPTVHLRFVERDGKHILQQQWIITHYDVNHRAIGQVGEWRDVPLEAETDE